MKIKIVSVSIFCALFALQIFSQTDQTMEMKQNSGKTKNASKMVTAEEASKNALNVGAKIPSFTLVNEKNEQVTSEDLLKENSRLNHAGFSPKLTPVLKELWIFPCRGRRAEQVLSIRRFLRMIRQSYSRIGLMGNQDQEGTRHLPG